jgi:hypothetical protein
MKEIFKRILKTDFLTIFLNIFFLKPGAKIFNRGKAFHQAGKVLCRSNECPDIRYYGIDLSG